MRNDYYSNSNDYINRWVISYADFVTMLLALFMVMFAVNMMGQDKVKSVNKSLEKVFTSTQTTQNVKNEETTKEEIATNAILDGSESILDSDTIMKEFKANTALENSVNVLKDKRGVIIRLNDTMLFDAGSAIIKPEAMATLEKIAASLNGFNNPVVIEGHTDSTPIKNEKFPSNWELSTARATNIISYLTQKHNFAPGRLSAVGYGEYMPIAQNDNPQNRSKNRRVDIIILSSDKK